MREHPYIFSINGEPVTPQHYSLNADPSAMAPGDVVCVGDGGFNYGALFMTLGEERDCRFVTIEPETVDTDPDDWFSCGPVRDGRVFLELPDGRRKVVGAIVTVFVRSELVDPDSPRPSISFEEFPVNPLETMSPDEIHGLWGIYLTRWPEGIEQKLAHVNTERACITLNDWAGVGGKTARRKGPVFPPIPVKTRYLVVKNVMSPGLRDFTHLGQFCDLVFLVFQSGGFREVLDADLISRNTSLRYLDVSRGHIKNCQKLAPLANLRFLNVGGFSNAHHIRNIEFVRGMHQLRALDIHRTRVSSLSPLDGSDSIQQIHAGKTKVRKLPKGDLRSLRAINLISTKVSARSVARFREAYPACKVEHEWKEGLCNAVAEATRLRVRSGGGCHRETDEETTLAEVAESQEIERFLAMIEIDEDESGGGCLCCGDPTFEFYAGDRLLAMLSYHHGHSLRWANGPWTGDAELTASSRDAVLSWLAGYGIKASP